MKKISTKNKLFIFLAVLGLLLFLHYTRIIKPAEIWLSRQTAIPENYLYQNSNKLSNFFYYFFNPRSLFKENYELREKVSQLSFEKSQLEILKTENENLKKSLNYFATKNEKFLTAKIIGRNLTNPQIFMIDQGFNAGLSPGLPAIIGDGIIIGKIISVSDQQAEVLILTDNQSLLAAKILNQSKTLGLVKGKLGTSAVLEMVPQEEKIEVGNLVVTSGLEEKVPSGLLIGEIMDVNQEVEEFFKTASLKPVFNINNLEYISIILPN